MLDGLEQLLLDGELAASTIGASQRDRVLAAHVVRARASKDQLFLLALDRFMHRIGREALESIDPAATPAAQLRQYVTADVRYAFQAAAYDDLSDVPGAPAARPSPAVRRHRHRAPRRERDRAGGVPRSNHRWSRRCSWPAGCASPIPM
ncbi:MAG: hypothetical protein R2713_23355 [Ilumatobacteraceae bacterium]